MKSFDESIIDLDYSTEAFLGSRLRFEYSVNDKFSAEGFKMTRKEFERRLEPITEWIFIDHKDKEFSKIVRQSDVYLDETCFEKQLMVHTNFKIDGFLYKGMPFQKHYKPIDLDPRRLTEVMESFYQGKLIPNENEVDRIYKYFGQHLVDLSADLNRRFKILVRPEHSEFLYDLYKKEKVMEIDSKKVRTLEEEKNFWKQLSESNKKEFEGLKTSYEQMAEEFSKTKEQNEILLEEKNFFMNCKYFKNTSDFSFLDEKSHEFNQTNFMNFASKDIINPIPLTGNLQNNTFDFGLIEEELQNIDIKKEYQQLKEKIGEYEKMLKNYRTEIERYKNLYSQNKIDILINENKQLKVKVNSLENQLEDYKNKLMKYDFAYKYISKEFESMKSFGSMFKAKKPDENFIMASNLTASLTKELLDRDKKITELEENLKKLKNEIAHNQTF